jgi:hypothetical protein
MAEKKPDLRLGALRRFAIAITILNVLGHTVLGFEQSWAYPLVALATAYSLEILFELIDARVHRRPPRHTGGVRNLVDFLLSAHITAMAVNMLLYANTRLLPIAFAVAVAIGSKAIFRAPVGNGSRHFMNPSNFGITLTLLAFSWVSIAPPYHFTENLDRIGDWLLPALIVLSGSFLNGRFTGKFPLIVAWVGGFVAQAFMRSLIFGTPLTAALLPMTGLAFILFTFYMITDPGTTPMRPHAQALFGVSVATVYGLLMMMHVVFTLFFALTIVCIVRGLSLHIQAWMARRASAVITAQVPVTVGRQES